MAMQRGAWFRTKAAGQGRPVCKEYTAAPGNGGCRVTDIPPNTFFGPAHDIVEGDTFCTVQVPSCLDPTLLVWVNVNKKQQIGGRVVWFAVPVNTRPWLDSGWHNYFVQ